MKSFDLLFGGSRQRAKLGVTLAIAIAGTSALAVAQGDGPGDATTSALRCLGTTATITGTTGADNLAGTARRDVIASLGGRDTISGLGGNDLICAGPGPDQISPGPGADRVSGGSGADRIAASAGADRELGEAGNDRLLGGGGGDRLFGAAGNDQLNGGPASDVCSGGTGTNTFAGCETRSGGGSGGGGPNPVASDDSATLSEDAAATAIDVLANDTATGGATKTIASATDPAHGTTVLTGAGSGLTYQPDPDYCGPDSFTYTLNSADSATVLVTVSCSPDVPDAVDDAATVLQGASQAPVPVLANDSDPDPGTTLAIQEASDPANGTTAISGGGTGLTYQPDPGYCNDGAPPEAFTYTINDASGRTDTATVAISVTCVGAPPLANDDSPPPVAEDSGTTNLAVLANDTDPESDPIHISAVSDPPNGTAAVVDGSPDQVSYSPGANFCGTDSFTYTVNGGDTATVSVTVTCVNDPPLAAVDSGTTNENTNLNVAAPGVLANDTDPDAGDTKTVDQVNGSAANVGAAITTTQGAALTLNANGSYTYNPSGSAALQALNVGGQLIDTFSYRMRDSASAPSNTVTVSITVSGVNDNPVADDETLSGANSAIGNTTLAVNMSAADPRKAISGATLNVLNGDSDIDGPGPLTAGPIGAQAITTNDGGKVTMEADGDFTYFPDANAPSCTDTTDFFTYTLSDGGGGTDTGQVNLTITGCAWYSNSALGVNGIGTSWSPFNSLAGLNGAGGAGDADGSADTLFLFGAGTYSGGLPLEANQRLFSQRHGLVVGADTLAVPSGATNPTITNASGNGLLLASGNTVQGINLGSTNAGSASLAGSSVGTATMNTATSGTITNASGGAVDISGGTLSMTFSSVSSTGATNDGIRLDNTQGAFTGSGGSLQTAGGQDVDISGNGASDDIAFTYNGTIADPVGTVVNVSNQSGGTKDFNGTIGALATPAGAISLTTNTGATVRFDGGVILSTGAAPAFTASGGGTVVVTDPNANGTAPDNTLATTTGTALNVANTTIGTGGLRFRSISANGAPTGIILNGTGSTAGLTVTGDGTNNVSGGLIQNATDGVLLTDTQDVSLTSIKIDNTTEDGVDGTRVANFSFINGTIDNSGTSHAPDTSNIGFNNTGTGTERNLTGTVTITGSTLNNAYYQGIDIFNYRGTIDNLNVSGNSLTSGTTTGGAGTSVGSGIRIVGFGDGAGVASITTATIDNNKINNFPGAVGLQVQGGNANGAGAPAGTYGVPGSATNKISMTNNQINVPANGATVKTGAEGIIALVNGVGQGNFDISGNNVQATTGISISSSAFGNAVVSETITGNTIVSNNTVAAQGIGIGTSTTGGFATNTPQLTATISNNTVSQTDGNGILAVARDSSGGKLNVSIKSNVVGAPLSGVRPGIRIDAGSASGDNDVCLDISGNTSAGSGGTQGIGLRKQGADPAVNAFGIEGLSPSPAATPAVESFINTANPDGNGTLLISATSGFTSCNTAP